MAKLKVYRTPAGFHDAYVAAPSQKAALAAWGSDANLFARGMAEVVSDPALTREPLAHPGEVIRVARTMADAPDDPLVPARATGRSKASSRADRPAPPAKPKPKPKPSRAAPDKAEAALEAAETRQAEERAQLKREEQELAARRRALDKAQAKERTELDRARIKAREAYEAALEEWRID
ncbi:hypothetical protein [Sphingomonas mucosissima]|uniref:Cell envelope biogenesis protein TolA n=1 Tax=Sphingomonas mucosissima TaxID=370959 RepID=A0A245ZLG5_9SPHN|nr:hypothetical protein [Sphingomonas mucosissima]OWK30584.1 hypothetical protein SPMU_15710 [Sphingomonas mucosissima]